MLVARTSLLIFAALLIFSNVGVAADDQAQDAKQRCYPMTPMWAGGFEELTGVVPKTAYQCDGDGYSVVFVEFENSSDCLAAEKTINENLEVEAEIIDGVGSFWEVYWSSSEEFGTLRISNILYLIAAPSINSSLIAELLNESSQASSAESEKPAFCTVWTKTFGGESYELGESVQQTNDGGFIITGSTGSYGAGYVDVWLIKTDSQGNEEWNKTFGGSDRDVGKSVQQTFDGGYIITGSTNSYGAGNEDVWLIKTDSQGDEEWNKTFGGEGRDEGYSAQQTLDGGFIITGEIDHKGIGGLDVWVIKTDSKGNEEWSKTFGGYGYDGGNSVQQTTDGGFIIAGYSESYGAGVRDFWLIKTDSQGNEMWNKTYGGSLGDQGESVQETADGGFIVTGEVYSSGANEWDIWVIKTDLKGNEEWSKTFGGYGHDWGSSVQQTADIGYIITGITQSAGADASDLRLDKTTDVWLIKTDSQGNEMWNKTYGGSLGDRGESVQETVDGGFIVTGGTYSYGAGECEVWLIKTDSEGNLRTEVESDDAACPS